MKGSKGQTVPLQAALQCRKAHPSDLGNANFICYKQ
jgi:hypothetical protein